MSPASSRSASSCSWPKTPGPSSPFTFLWMDVQASLTVSTADRHRRRHPPDSRTRHDPHHSTAPPHPAPQAVTDPQHWRKPDERSWRGTAMTEKKYEGFTDEERAAMKERAAGAEDGRAPPAREEGGGRGKRPAREDRRDAGTGSRHGRAAPCHRQGQRARALAPRALVRDARVRQGRQGGLLLPGPRRSSRRGTRRSASTTRRTSTTGSMWPTAFALTTLTAADEEAGLGALIKQAVS